MKRSTGIFVLVILLPLLAQAQASHQLGLLPSINLNKKLPKDWSLNFKAESRQSMYRGGFDYEYLLTDVALVAAKKIGINTSAAAGYLMRIDAEGVRHRAIQQISFVKRYAGFRLSHRVSADQTFENGDAPEYRLRYRLSSEVPLQGLSLDPKEFFLKLSNEYLGSMQHDDLDLEIRAAAFIGYAISPKQKLELGLDYRLDSFIHGQARNRYWIGLNFYQSL
jgi:hypothetical protein